MTAEGSGERVMCPGCEYSTLVFEKTKTHFCPDCCDEDEPAAERLWPVDQAKAIRADRKRRPDDRKGGPLFEVTPDGVELRDETIEGISTSTDLTTGAISMSMDLRVPSEYHEPLQHLFDRLDEVTDYQL